MLLLLKPSFGGGGGGGGDRRVTRVKTIGASEFAAGRFGIPVHFKKTKQGYGTEEAAQTRFNRSTHMHACARPEQHSD